jgi:predicted dehydrogenase
VLRYSPLYRRVRAILDAGIIGQVISIDAHEGVEPYHQAHSFVRGHWGIVENSAPMILAKSCHDMDLLVWFAGAKATSVKSAGGLTHFTNDNAPEGAPERCHQNCPVADSCFYNANRYLADKKGWLRMIHPSGEIPDVNSAATREWLESSPWGRCVYRCDNTAVDHQAVVIGFANGVTATFHMTAFDCGRHLEIHGTKGRLRAGDHLSRVSDDDIVIEDHYGKITREKLGTDGEGYDGHMGGDGAMIEGLYEQLTGADDPATALAASVESHRIAFAAEADRKRAVPSK